MQLQGPQGAPTACLLVPNMSPSDSNLTPGVSSPRLLPACPPLLLQVGYAPSLADIACWAQLQLTLQWDRLRKGGALPHLARW